MRLSELFNTARGGLKARLESSVTGLLTSIAGVSVCLCLTGCFSFEPISYTGQGFFYPSVSYDNTFVTVDGTVTDAPGNLSSESYPPVSMTLTCIESGASHTWPDLRDFDVLDGYNPGDYRVQMSCAVDAHYDLVADTVVYISSYFPNRHNLILRPSKSLLEISSVTKGEEYEIDSLVVHSITSGDYSILQVGGSESAFISPDNVEFVGRIVRKSDQKVLNLVLSKPFSLKRGWRYNADVILDGSDIDISIGNVTGGRTVNDALFDSPEPSVTDVGFVSGEAFSVTEGVPLTHPVRMEITSGFPLEHIYITAVSPIVGIIKGEEQTLAEADLLNLTPAQADFIAKTKLDFTLSDDGMNAVIDFAKAIESVSSLSTARSTFIVWAVDEYGRASMPSQLDVDTRAVDFEVVSVDHAVFGLNEGGVRLRPGLPGVEVADLKFVTEMADKRYLCPIQESRLTDDGCIDLRFTLPEGSDSYETLKIDVEYMSLPRTAFDIKRIVPQFSVEPDAYATSARLTVSATDGRVANALVSLLSFYNGTERCAVLSRDTVNNVITVNGLSPSTRYGLSARLPKMATDLIRTSFTTEAALPIPDGDFEDAVLSVLKYPGLPSGGRYAISPIDVANRQNKVNIDEPWLKKHWSSVNGRTFCMSASNPNTWYMQPSSQVVYDAKSGSKAMKIMSVGWDLNGPAIPDYVPEQAYPVPTYSLVVPEVAHRSAGRLFLGKYTFDARSMTEILEEGTPFTSRPSSLNGFYKFQPDETVTSDRGSVRVALVNRYQGKDTVVAEGYMEFTASPDYTAFNVPIKYYLKDVKPTHLCILFMSSSRGDTVAVDDVDVPVTAFPERGAMQGSILWVDNLSFTY